MESIHGEASLDYSVYTPFLTLWSTMGATPGLLMVLRDSFIGRRHFLSGLKSLLQVRINTLFLVGIEVALTGCSLDGLWESFPAW